MQKIQQHLLIQFSFYNPIVVIPLYHMRSTSYFSGCFCYGSVLLSITFLCFNICSFWHCPQHVLLATFLHYCVTLYGLDSCATRHKGGNGHFHNCFTGTDVL